MVLRFINLAALAFLCIFARQAPGAEVKAAAADWPLFRGNTLQTGVAASALPAKLAIRWKFPTKDAIESTAAIVGDTVYIGSLDGNLYALQLATGKLKWSVKTGPIKAPVSVRNGAVYAGSEEGDFHCLEAASGKAIWSYKTEADITSGPNFAGDTVLFGCGDETLYCLNKDGKLVWKFRVAGGPVLGSPAIVGKRTFVSGCDSSLHVLDTADGKEIRAVDLGAQTGATPAIVGDILYLGNMNNQVLAVDWNKGEVLWKFEAKKNQQPFFASCAVTDSLVIAGSRDRRLHALDRKTGKRLWDFTTGGKVDSSPVIVGKRIYAPSLDGNLYVLDLDLGSLVEKIELGKGISASPAVASGCLVIGTQEGVVYCLGAN